MYIFASLETWKNKWSTSNGYYNYCEILIQFGFINFLIYRTNISQYSVAIFFFPHILLPRFAVKKFFKMI